MLNVHCSEATHRISAKSLLISKVREKDSLSVMAHYVLLALSIMVFSLLISIQFLDGFGVMGVIITIISVGIFSDIYSTIKTNKQRINVLDKEISLIVNNSYLLKVVRVKGESILFN